MIGYAPDASGAELEEDFLIILKSAKWFEYLKSSANFSSMIENSFPISVAADGNH